jgi:hypothetical protein
MRKIIIGMMVVFAMVLSCGGEEMPSRGFQVEDASTDSISESETFSDTNTVTDSGSASDTNTDTGTVYEKATWVCLICE